MRLERLLQISIAVLVSLSTLLLGMGERNLTLPVVAVIVSVSSLYLTDFKGWLQLNTTVTNIAGLVALAATWHDWDYYAGESQLLSMANLLIYLQFVLLYRRKDVRNYWLLILLSLLQVAVASALNMSIFFGLLLLIYMFIGLITLALFSIYREHFYSQELWKPWRANEAAEAERAAADRRRWPLAAHAAVFAGLPPDVEADAGLTWGWVRQIMKLGVLTLILSSMMFFGLPRVGKAGRWRAGNTRILRTVGFSESVTLGELGEAYQNDNALMQAWFSDAASGEPYRVAGDMPLFRGALLYHYHQGQWQRRSERFERDRHSALPRTPMSELPTDTPLVKQKITLQPRDDQTLFSVFPVFRGDSDSAVNYSAENEQLYRSPRKQSEPFTYELYTSGFRDHLYSMIVPATREVTQHEYQFELLQTPIGIDGEDMLPGLRKLAAQLVSEIPPADRERQARTLEMYLRDLTKFRYSLKGVERDPNLDPVEDFVTKHPVGHCEYFASALTLMLRSVKIPARMAIGFKGGEWNDAGKYYQVRELHAHTWVEAWLSPENLPPNLRSSKLAQKDGAWLILDPTPAGSDADRYEILGLYSWKQLFDLSQFVWSNYVLGMDSQRQQESIYQPLVARIEEQLKQFADEEYRQQLWERLGQKLGGQRFGLSAGWLSWQGLLVAATAVLAVTGGYRGSKRAIKPVRRWVRKRWDRTLGRAGARVEFYERFEALLARRQWVRAASQTPREFALSVGGQFAESPATKQAAVLPRRVVEAFYRVRFGGQRLDNSESQAVEQAISDLADALKAAESNTDSRA
jgi:hypothetical protein